MCVISVNMSIFTCCMLVYMYVHALTPAFVHVLKPPVCGLSFICDKVLFCSIFSDH